MMMSSRWISISSSSSGTVAAAFVIVILLFLSACQNNNNNVLAYSDQVPREHHHQMVGTTTTAYTTTNNDTGSTTIPPSVLFNNCDVDIYYKDHKNDGEWSSWNRNEIASLLLLTHRQVIPYDDESESSLESSSLESSAVINDGSSSSSLESKMSSTSRIVVATNITIRKALIELDKDPSDEEWKPGYLWPMNGLAVEMTTMTNIGDELLAAGHDLHNTRPTRQHPIVHNNDRRTKNWYYDECDDCKFVNNNENNDAVLLQRIDDSPSSSSSVASGKIGGDDKWNGFSFDDTMDSNNNGEGSDHLCVCTDEHALQPPKSARGEIARALLYMNLRYYGTLNLTLTDCSPTLNNNDNDNDNDNSNSMMGYFTRLIKWHLDDPPSSEEKFRNNKICELYQGNRNPFIDFYEESWALLDFDSIDREVCEGAGGSGDAQGIDKEGDDDVEKENDDDYVKEEESSYDDDYYNDDYVEEEESTSSFSSSSLSTDEPTSATTTIFMGCHQFLTGDISFFMVQPAAGDSSDLSNNEEDYLNQNEEWQRNSFGLVTLVDLKPGLVLFVAGVNVDVDVDVDVNVNVNVNVDDNRDAGILKVVVPDQGIKAGQYFGYGSQMYLGDQWEPILEENGGNGDGDEEEFRFSVHQLYLYCIDEDDKDDDMGIGNNNNNGKEEYNILAALSTTGRSFGNGLLPSSFWEDYQNQHSNVVLSDSFRDIISSNGGSNYYGVIVLPGDASEFDISGGYRYTGPTYTKHDQYAKALINESYWERINSINGFDCTGDDEGTITRPPITAGTNINNLSSEEEQQQQQRSSSSSSGNGSHSTLRVEGISHYCSILASLALPLGISFW
ncbi:Endonuclease_1-domain-containing protein [Fragilariopsis cylindrus CCMP1102]|uniref:Endonuclease_1-domain-containing protein n=1 Tax=Fragilariopsis cylindrus CCMP1102 TaxID=635003 RepID=A0A1E7FTX5_9STRA|nr:Endonuclease_1-domain-containing protein [Fragilariopsis cylindrus CCMP1102]|eukprot:OEU21610.1 Endonuclease_1-domain-containing protein [Fragilariopsis cylindrus CCMP1102]